MRIEYIADDGTQFGSQAECEAYENKLKLEKSNIVFLDADFLRVNNSKYAFYIYLPTKSARDTLWNLFEINCPSAGFYAYDYQSDDFYSLEDEITTLQHQIEDIKNKINIIKGIVNENT